MMFDSVSDLCVFVFRTSIRMALRSVRLTSQIYNIVSQILTQIQYCCDTGRILRKFFLYTRQNLTFLMNVLFKKCVFYYWQVVVYL